MCVDVLPTCMAVHHMCAVPMPEKAKREDIGSPGTRVTNGCELPCGHWESNRGPLQEQTAVFNHRAISSSLVTSTG